MPKTLQIHGFCMKNYQSRFLKGFSSDNVHISPYISKAKICLEAVDI